MIRKEHKKNRQMHLKNTKMSFNCQLDNFQPKTKMGRRCHYMSFHNEQNQLRIASYKRRYVGWFYSLFKAVRLDLMCNYFIT